jgi:hypothetical protein
MGTNLPRATPGVGALHRWTRRKFIVVIPARLLVIRARDLREDAECTRRAEAMSTRTDDASRPRRMT